MNNKILYNDLITNKLLIKLKNLSLKESLNLIDTLDLSQFILTFNFFQLTITYDLYKLYKYLLRHKKIKEILITNIDILNNTSDYEISEIINNKNLSKYDNVKYITDNTVTSKKITEIFEILIEKNDIKYIKLFLNTELSNYLKYDHLIYFRIYAELKYNILNLILNTPTITDEFKEVILFQYLKINNHEKNLIKLFNNSGIFVKYNIHNWFEILLNNVIKNEHITIFYLLLIHNNKHKLHTLEEIIENIIEKDSDIILSEFFKIYPELKYQTYLDIINNKFNFNPNKNINILNLILSLDYELSEKYQIKILKEIELKKSLIFFCNSPKIIRSNDFYEVLYHKINKIELDSIFIKKINFEFNSCDHFLIIHKFTISQFREYIFDYSIFNMPDADYEKIITEYSDYPQVIYSLLQTIKKFKIHYQSIEYNYNLFTYCIENDRLYDYSENIIEIYKKMFVDNDVYYIFYKFLNANIKIPDFLIQDYQENYLPLLKNKNISDYKRVLKELRIYKINNIL
jgi:hypothetical protein